MEDSNKFELAKSVPDNIYQFDSPRWDAYFKETQKTVKYPRGYKDVSLLDF